MPLFLTNPEMSKPTLLHSTIHLSLMGCPTLPLHVHLTSACPRLRSGAVPLNTRRQSSLFSLPACLSNVQANRTNKILVLASADTYNRNPIQ